MCMFTNIHIFDGYTYTIHKTTDNNFVCFRNLRQVLTNTENKTLTSYYYW